MAGNLLVTLLLMFVLQTHGASDGVLVTAISTALVVVGTLVLVLGSVAVFVGILIFKIISSRYPKQSELLEVQEPLEIPQPPATGLHMYEQVDMLLLETEGYPTSDNMPQPYLLQGNLTTHIPEKEEVMQCIDEQLVTEAPTALEQSLVTQNPFYTQVDNIRDHTIPEYENHELRRKEHTEEKKDMSSPGEGAAEITNKASPEQLEEAPLLETALNFYHPDDIEGEIIEEVEYQNVTVLRTRIRDDEEKHQSKNGSQGDAEPAIPTLAVQWQENETSLSGNRNGNSTVAMTKEQRATTDGNYHGLGNTITAGDSLNKNNPPKPSGESYADVTSTASVELYQNFERVHNDKGHALQGSSGSLEDYENVEKQNVQENVVHTGSIDNYYMNVPSVHKQGHSTRGSSTDEDDGCLDYENVTPEQYKTKQS